MADMPDLVSTAAKKPDKWAQFRGLPKWQAVLAIFPLSLIAVGGALGGAIGALAMGVNLKLARTQLTAAPKALSMVCVALGAVTTYLALAALLQSVLK
jgi:hypothetical protein